MEDTPSIFSTVEVTRRTVIETGTTALLLSSLPHGALAAGTDQAEPSYVSIELRVNGHLHHLTLDPRTTLLDALREHLALTGSKLVCLIRHRRVPTASTLREKLACLATQANLSIGGSQQEILHEKNLDHDRIHHDARCIRSAGCCGYLNISDARVSDGHRPR